MLNGKLKISDEDHSFLALRVFERILAEGQYGSVWKIHKALEKLIHTDGRFVERETLDSCINPVPPSGPPEFFSYYPGCETIVSYCCSISYATVYSLHVNCRLTDVAQIPALIQTPQKFLEPQMADGRNWKVSYQGRR